MTTKHQNKTRNAQTIQPWSWTLTWFQSKARTSASVSTELCSSADSGHRERVLDPALGVVVVLQLVAQAAGVGCLHSSATRDIRVGRVRALHCFDAGGECTQAALRIHSLKREAVEQQQNYEAQRSAGQLCVKHDVSQSQLKQNSTTERKKGIEHSVRTSNRSLVYVEFLGACKCFEKHLVMVMKPGVVHD